MRRVGKALRWIARAVYTGLSATGGSLSGMGHLLPETRPEPGCRPRQGPPSGHPERLVPLLPMSEQERRLWSQLDYRQRPAID